MGGGAPRTALRPQICVSGHPWDEVPGPQFPQALETKVVKNNELNPQFGETFELVVNFPQMAVLSFQVYDWEPNGSTVVAEAHVPVDLVHEVCVGGRGSNALQRKGPQRRPRKRFGRRLEEVAKAVGGGYCRLPMPVKLALGVRGHRLSFPFLFTVTCL